MTTEEKEYLDTVSKALASNEKSLDIVNELNKVEIKDPDKLSTNAQLIRREIGYLDFQRDLGSFENKEVEETRAKEIIDKVRKFLEDIDSGNTYQTKYYLSFVYSRLRGNDYSYKDIDKKIDVSSYKEAEKRRDEAKSSGPKTHPDHPDFTLEDIRIGSYVIDSKGEKVSINLG